MSRYIELEAAESSEEEYGPPKRKIPKPSKHVPDSSDEDDEDDDERIREELKDLIDDTPIQESEDEDSDDSSSKKRKRSDGEETDDELEDEDYDLIEENLGRKVERRPKYKRLKAIQDEESDNEDADDSGSDHGVNAGLLLLKDDAKSAERVEDEENYSDTDDFIVDDDDKPITNRKSKRTRTFVNPAYQEAQEMFGVDFDYDDFAKYDEEDDEDDYDDEEDEQGRRRKTSQHKRRSKKTIFEIYEPDELRRGFFTDLDNEIRNTDVPERMQMRQVPITSVPEDSKELDDEAEWIYKQAFCKRTVSRQGTDLSEEERERQTKGPETTPKIRNALDLMRNQQLEVPFIAFYRKERVQPELNINDLWKIYKFDAKWCQLKSSKENLMELFEKMYSYQSDRFMKDPVAPIPDNVRLLHKSDVDRLKDAQTVEELADIRNHFYHYHSADFPKMHAAWRLKQRLQRIAEKKTTTEEPEEESRPEKLKSANRSTPYDLSLKAGIGGLSKRFGLTPEHFAENLRDNYQRHKVDQETIEPEELAKEFISTKYATVEEVLQAAKYVVTLQIVKDPLVRKCVREAFFERAKMTVQPTKKGFKEIDESHTCFTMKYVKDKPVRNLTNEQFLQLSLAEDDNFLTISISEDIEGSTYDSYISEVKHLYIKDDFSKTAQAWNALRMECVERALKEHIIPDVKKELKQVLLAEAKEAVLKACREKLHDWIKWAPYKVEFPDEGDDDWNTSRGVKVMAIAYVPDYTRPAFACLAGSDGDITDYLRLPHLLKRKNSYRTEDKILKEADLLAIRNFILTKKPHVVAIGGESMETLMIVEDIRGVVNDLVNFEQFPNISVEVVDNELAKVYSNSNKGTSDFREYPELLRQAISIARKMQDPLIEYSQLCNTDDEILSLRYHPLQEQISKDELLENIFLEFVNRTNEVGVDINLAVQQAHKSHLVQFICGLGPRKGQALLRVLKQTNQRLENRTQLVTSCHMGPKVFINCSGFVKINTNSFGDSTEAYVEILDGSRIHPETYEWARKMAIDALEYDEVESVNTAEVLEEILKAPKKLRDLNLDAFAVELEKQGFGNKVITLYDIRAELNSRYRDLRQACASPNSEELFGILTKETPENFFVGKLITSTVSGIARRKPTQRELDQANPVRKDETGSWQCPICLKKDFAELSDVWKHFNERTCPGKATGIKLRLDNGVSGYIETKNISDKFVLNPEERVRIGQVIHCRITRVDVGRFSVVCTSKSSDLADKNCEWRPDRDRYYDQERADEEIRAEQALKQQQQNQTYVRRLIVHPAFKNISYPDAEKLMAPMAQGEAIIRPSSKGANHLTITWKVTETINQHIDVIEEGKENAFSLGKSLLINGEKFADLDEIIARHVNPMASYARDLLYFRYYKDTDGGMKDKASEYLMEMKKKHADKINYILSACKNYPGKFLLSYLPRCKVTHEFITVTPDGLRFRQQMFYSLDMLFAWFKKHFRDPIPGTPTTPGAPPTNSLSQTANAPSLNVNPKTNQKVRHAQLPGVYESSAHVNTPYTPIAQTSFQTPYQTQQPLGYTQVIPSRAPMNSPFLHSGAVTSGILTPSCGNVNQSPTMQAGPCTGSSSKRSHHGVIASTAIPSQSQRNYPDRNRSHGSYGNTQEPMDLQMAAKAWTNAQKRNGAPARNEGRRKGRR